MLGTLKDVGLLADSFRLLATPIAVISGLTYNFLPFMVLPLYVALEKIDPRLVEAATDLYASRLQAFLRVTLPALHAGRLRRLAARPSFRRSVTSSTRRSSAAATPTMIGNVIQRLFLNTNDYPQARGARLRADGRDPRHGDRVCARGRRERS